MSTLMVSISGVRGIIGGGLEPEVLVKYTAAYADFVKGGTVVVGRDSRISGEMVKSIAVGTLMAKGINVVDLGICPTPTVLFMIKKLSAQGGICFSASHNPNQWNALKLMSGTGEFMSPEEHTEMKSFLESPKSYATWDKLGTYTFNPSGIKEHMAAAIAQPFVDVEQIRTKKFKVVLDCVNGAGSFCMPEFLEQFGCEVIEMNCEKTGIFPRNPEPLPENLVETMNKVKVSGADLGIVVDPDVDRLVLITDKGEPFSEENTVTFAAQWVLSKQKGPVVVNLSTTRAIEDIANAAGVPFYRSPVGEANVVKKMKEVSAIIGGEGSGGVIYPTVNFGRDSFVGTSMALQSLAESGKKLSQVKDELPHYDIAKRKIDLGSVNPDSIITEVIAIYSEGKQCTDDGLRIDFADHWVHFRKSNTEPIIRIIVEAQSLDAAESYSAQYFTTIQNLMKKG